MQKNYLVKLGPEKTKELPAKTGKRAAGFLFVLITVDIKGKNKN